ncbi:NADPH-dependent 7-cyano-7-deazaguanine reductase QueF [Aliidiomarina indica]|uniref:NADPH-dependent 7-cyano-7-deazaguanine reductase QueF n=1 Tax=Aliidiomarina indica TaxID=2749147 RepID=UPI00188E183F|nr:NADPH-dependent 7-cyano-7-deazaguanine reductase QueF [Aliidiomarina indica]
MPENPESLMQHLTLGQATEYPTVYDAQLLQAVPRHLNRTQIGLSDSALPFVGRDLWTGYELSWLQPSGVPAVAIIEVEVPATSPNLIESKSFKLYLNSFNQSVFTSHETVAEQLQNDLSQCAGESVSVRIYPLDDYTQHGLEHWHGHCIDHEDITTDCYDYTPDILNDLCPMKDLTVTEQLHSHLLKSNCLITNQPDWGSVFIAYRGPKMSSATLLKYLISFRNHNEFHEQCVERIFTDLMQYGRCEELLVCARYTRRGGLDINPLRATPKQTLLPDPTKLLRGRLARQ